MDNAQRLQAVLDVAREYHYDAPHAHQVECIAGTMFVDLQDLHGLESTDRKLLEYAAILHDIGYAVSAKSHHRHTLMMILTEPWPQFSRDEVKVIANVARYHRKALPMPDHTLYGVLDEKNRRRVDFLAAMLRTADALDRSKRGIVKELTCEVNEEQVIFHVVAEGDPTQEIAAVQRRGDLFRAVFRKTPVVDIAVPKLATPEAVFQVA